MKSLIIIGVTRSGKTTLAEMICQKYHFSLIQLDYLIRAFKYNLPECGIGSWIPGGTERLAPFLYFWINSLAKPRRPMRYVVEGCEMDVETAHKSINHDHIKIVALGYPNQTPKGMLAEIRKHDTENDWSSKQNDERMLWELDEYGVQRSQEILERCKELGITFIDTGADDRGKKLQTFVNNLETFLE